MCRVIVYPRPVIMFVVFLAWAYCKNYSQLRWEYDLDGSRILGYAELNSFIQRTVINKATNMHFTLTHVSQGDTSVPIWSCDALHLHFWCLVMNLQHYHSGFLWPLFTNMV